MSLLDRFTLAPADPILGLTEKFNADPRGDKINLGVGVYVDEQGQIPLMRSVELAERRLADEASPHGYLGIAGSAAYLDAVRSLVFGEDASVLAEGRVATVQSLGGTGALKIGAELLHQADPSATVLISDPSWENHRALFTRAGFTVETYRYYSAERRGVDFEGMMQDLRAATPGSIVVLHACCHNPTGYDLDPQQWDQVIALLRERGLVAFLDMAYQGFGTGIAEDGKVVDKLIEAGAEFFLATSYSKSFGLYGERIGSLSIVTDSAEAATRVLSQAKLIIRTIYSNPPTHGAALVSGVLTDPTLRQGWEAELGGMRERIDSLRRQLVTLLAERGINDMGFIAHQRGMFSYSGLTKQQMHALRDEHAIYGTETGRLCVAALNADNLARVVDAIVAVRG